MIKEYKHPLLSGKPCMIHEDFIRSMDLFCRYLELVKCSAFINSSFRENANVNGAIVKPATRSNHMVGCAIDCNLIDKNKKMWSSKEMAHPENEVLQLINLVRRSNLLRWGGDFTPDIHGNTDPVHFDNAINILNPKKWDEMYNEIHTPIV